MFCQTFFHLDELGEGTHDLDVLLAGAKDLAAGGVQRGVLLVVAGLGEDVAFGHGIDHAADVSPVDGARAHGARLAGGVERALPEVVVVKLPAGGLHEGGLGVAGADVL